MRTILTTITSCVFLLALMLFVASGDMESEEGVNFIVANGAEPESIDPHVISGTVEHRIFLALFEALLRPDAETGLGVPGLAESWTISDDQTVYTMKIRKEAKWSDGVDITAETVRDSWFRVLNPDTAASYAWFPGLFIKGAAQYTETGSAADKENVAIRALDADTFQFETVGPLPYAISALSHYSFAVVPLHVIEEHGNDWILPENFVGNGPFVLDEWSPQEILKARKNETYWDAQNVFIDTIEFIPVEDNNTAFNMYENQEVDWSANSFPTGKFDSIRGREDVKVAPILGTYYYEFNHNRPPLNDPRVRKALALTINRDGITQEITGEGQVSAYSMVPPMPGYTQIDYVKENEQIARDLLAEAGFSGGEGFPNFTILYNTSEAHKKIAEYIQQRWQEVLGITVTLENQEWKTYLTSREEHEFDIARGGWIGDYPDPNTFLDMFVAGNALNHGDYNSSEYDALIKQAATSSGEERFALLRKAEELLINTDSALTPIYHYVSQDLIDTTKWEGWHTNLMQTHPYVGLRRK